MEETLTIKQRMELLNLQDVTRPKPYSKPKPPLPPRPQSTGCNTNQHGQDHISTIGNLPAAAPAKPPTLPEKKSLVSPILPRRDSTQSNVPPRRQSVNLNRRGSQDSIASTTSAMSTLSTRTAATTASRTPSFDGSKGKASYIVKAPEYDPASLPKLPPKTPQPPKRPSLSISRTTSNPISQPIVEQKTAEGPPPLPSRRVSVTPSFGECRGAQAEERAVRNVPPRPRIDPRSFAMNKASTAVPEAPQRPQAALSERPPPVPAGSRPDLSLLQASKPRLTAQAPVVSSQARTAVNPQAGCLKCRDFKAVDQHAAQYPRQSLPSSDLRWLAHELCDPFPSLTDKARAIFIWLHFNIIYNVEALFAGNIKPSTPASTLATGLAVCEGYAALFTSLATYVGMESIVVGGHGKGYGYKALQPGEALPSFDGNHAWNAVRIDSGQWKLIDACWGAGHLGADNKYHQILDPGWFVKDEAEFGEAHFPQDRNHFFRADGRLLTWEEYIVGSGGPGEPLQVYGGILTEHGLSATSFIPPKKHIRVSEVSPKTRVQFQFKKVCEHFDSEKAGLGKPYVYVLSVGGKDGRQRTYVPFQTNGSHWWVDVATEELGCQGQTVQVFSVTSVNGEEGRGMSVEFVKTWIGRRAMAFGGVVSYQLI